MAAGEMDSEQYPELGYTKCENGFAAAIPGDFNNTFRCNNVSFFHSQPSSTNRFRSICTISSRMPS